MKKIERIKGGIIGTQQHAALLELKLNEVIEYLDEQSKDNIRKGTTEKEEHKYSYYSGKWYHEPGCSGCQPSETKEKEGCYKCKNITGTGNFICECGRKVL